MKKFLSLLLAAAMLIAVFTAAVVNIYAEEIELEPEEPAEPLYTRDGDYIYFGEWPQTVASNEVAIDTSEPDARGYYLGDDGEYYAMVIATPYNDYDTYVFSTGETVVEGATYFFKVEPIKWRILHEESGVAFLFCDSIIANRQFHSEEYNNYEASDLRAWLNNEFFTTAFNTLEQELIQLTTVDNSESTTGYTTNPYACADTEDRIFLLSYAEATNSEYGFDSNAGNYDTSKMMVTSDYSRATGAITDTGDQTHGYWWMRSPCGDAADFVRGIPYSGHADSIGYVCNFEWGVVPAMYVALDETTDDGSTDITESGSEAEPDTETETEDTYTGPDVNGYYRFVSHVDGEDKIWTSTNKGIGSSASRMTFISTVNGAISFYARTSSEAGCDVLRVYVNGKEKMALSAETDYESYMVNVSLGDEVVFEYKKDITANRGDDTAYVKNVYFVAHTVYLPEVDEDETQTWPDENGYYGFECTKEGNDVIWASNNQGVGGSTARMSIIVKTTGTMAFYASVSSETNYDKLIVYHNGSEIFYRSGAYNYEMVTLDVSAGDEILFTYSKDGGSDSNYDTAWIKNIVYTDAETSIPTELPFEQPTESETETLEEGTQTEDGTGIEDETESKLVTEDEIFTAGEDGIYEFIEDENGNWMSTNNSQGNSIARKTITCDKTGLYNISVNISSEHMCDMVVIYVGDEVVYTVSGDHNEKTKVYVSAGDVMTIEYIKDESRDIGSDRAIISLTFKEGEVPGVDISGGSGESSGGSETEKATEAETVMSGSSAIMSGCFATLGTGAFAVIVTAMISLCAFRKKED